MKKALLLITFAFYQFSSIGQVASNEIVINKYASSFSKAYSLHPEIPRGILEAVSFCNTHFAHLQHISTQPESCNGMPNAYSVMGLIWDGQNYFSNNLITVSKLSGYSVEEITGSPEKSILAYAAAYVALKQSLKVAENTIAEQAPILIALSHLPQETEGQIFALNSQLYGYLQFLSTAKYQKLYSFSNHNIDFTAVFGENNYKVLSSPSLTLTEESIYTKDGQHFQPKSLQSTDYGPAVVNMAGSCNYGSRNGTAISAVVVHDTEGPYTSAISWFQNCASNASAHYLLRSSDGQVIQMVLEADKGFHIGSENSYTIGLEHEGFVNDSTWYTNAMYVSSADLVRDICSSGYGINPLRTYYGPGCSGTTQECGLGACTKIKGHQMFPNQTHSDPGPYWHWAEYYHLINNAPSINLLSGASGNFYDSGGSSGNYTDDERILTLIQPAGATAVTLNFTSFDTELNWDYLFIYDGSTTSAPLLGKFTGSTGPGTITSSGASLLIEFRSDCATDATGWVANWTSNALPSSIEEKLAVNSLSAHPNPFINNTTISYQLNKNSNVRITLTDVLGKEVILSNTVGQTAGRHEILLNTADLKLGKGMYFVKLTADSEQKLVKIIVT